METGWDGRKGPVYAILVAGRALVRADGGKRKKPSRIDDLQRLFSCLAEWTGLEPATPGVTGRYSNQLNYHSAVV